MADYGASDTSTTPLGVNQFPVSDVYVPNVGLKALGGGPKQTDGSNKDYAPALMYVPDGNDVAAGTTTDTAYAGSGAASRVSVLKGIFNKLAGILGIQQADLTATGTISAAQPVIGTPVANATVQLALGQGQSSWMAQLVAGAGFTSATTIVVDQSIDGGTTWFVTNFKVAGSLTTTPVQSVVGPGPLLLSGDAASKGIIRIRCSVLNASETINVQLRSGAGVGSVGLLSSIPAGGNVIGGVTFPTSTIGTPTSVTAAASSTSLLVLNASRLGAYFYNDSTAILYLLFNGGTASTTNYTVQIPANGFFEMPVAPIYTGAIKGIWSAVNGAVRITEMS